MKSIKFTTKLFVGIIAILLFSMAAFLLTALIEVKSGLTDLGHISLENTTTSVFNSLKMQNELLQEKLDGDLKIMDQEFGRLGTFALAEGQQREETIVNQITKQKETVNIPSLTIGQTTINGNFDLVDRVQKLNGGTATVFQVLDNKLLRVSTNVLKTDGSRAVGTYIPSSSPVYQTVMNGQTFRGKAFVVSDWYLTAYKPLRDIEGKIVAVIYVGRKILSPQLRSFLSSTKVGEDGYFFVYNSKGELLVHPTMQGENVFVQPDFGPLFQAHKGGMLEYQFKGMTKVVYSIFYEDWDWYLVAGMDREKMVHGLDKRIRNKFLGMGVLVLVIGTLTALFLTRSIAQALSLLAEKSLLVARGDYTQSFAYPANDAIGKLVESLNTMMQSTRQLLGEITGASAALGETSHSIAEKSRLLVEKSQESGASAEKTATSTDDVRGSMQSVSAAMEEASINVNTVATAASEMSSTIQDIAAHSERAKQTTTQAVQRADESSKRVDQLGQAAKEINAVTETITEISSQTNLLALNATIEAARAGEAGKGFAVVANEIKELAKQTAEATEDIREKINGIQSATKLTVQEMAEISNIIGEMNDIVSTIATAVEEQAATTSEIAGNVSQASQGLGEINENVALSSSMTEQINTEINVVRSTSDEVVANSQQIALSVEELASLARKLDGVVSRFTM